MLQCMMPGRAAKRYVCRLDGCGKSFTQLGNLKTHMNRFNGRECEQEGYSFALPQINWLLPQMLNPSCTKNRLLLFDLLLYSRPRESVSHISEKAPLAARIPCAASYPGLISCDDAGLLPDDGCCILRLLEKRI
ncbi:hypothetical protein GMDG_08469 [Pseudogymnoascus destructans 20631-21]|uniref:C2H2-type domain-containing protein n=1 Tax=Pseudogymnoascus destructans (strain ATCC MYA-4855 / 20631-21) TaxID=658429 RepID=L8G428_PSED2|nr:hypothetical protein GMDG_08469 [Pseudogymnoascus destructans 20631-21]